MNLTKSPLLTPVSALTLFWGQSFLPDFFGAFSSDEEDEEDSCTEMKHDPSTADEMTSISGQSRPSQATTTLGEESLLSERNSDITPAYMSTDTPSQGPDHDIGALEEHLFDRTEDFVPLFTPNSPDVDAKVSMDIDAITVCGNGSSNLLRALHYPVTAMAHSVIRRQHVNQREKLAIQRTEHFCPRDGGSTPKNYKLHRFRNIKLLRCRQEGPVSYDFQLSLFLTEENFIRKHPYLDRFYLGAIVSALNAARTSLVVFLPYCGFESISTQMQIAYQNTMSTMPAFTTEDGSGKLPIPQRADDNAWSPRQQRQFHPKASPTNSYTEMKNGVAVLFWQAVTVAFQNMADSTRWLVDYSHFDYCGRWDWSDGGACPKLEQAAQDILQHGVFLLKTAGNKNQFSCHGSPILKLNDRTFMNKWIAQQNQALMDVFRHNTIDVDFCHRHYLPLFVDVALSVSPFSNQFSFLLNGDNAGRLLKVLATSAMANQDSPSSDMGKSDSQDASSSEEVIDSESRLSHSGSTMLVSREHSSTTTIFGDSPLSSASPMPPHPHCNRDRPAPRDIWGDDSSGSNVMMEHTPDPPLNHLALSPIHRADHAGGSDVPNDATLADSQMNLSFHLGSPEHFDFNVRHSSPPSFEEDFVQLDNSDSIGLGHGVTASLTGLSPLEEYGAEEVAEEEFAVVAAMLAGLDDIGLERDSGSSHGDDESYEEDSDDEHHQQQLPSLIDTVGNTGNHLYPQFGTAGALANIQRGGATISIVPHHVNNGEMQVVCPPSGIVGAQAYMPVTRQMKEGQTNASFFAKLHTLPEAIKQLFLLALTGRQSSDDYAICYHKAATQIYQLEAVLRSTLSTWSSDKPHHCRFEITHCWGPDHPELPSFPTFPCNVSDALYVCKNQDMLKHLAHALWRDYRPLFIAFPPPSEGKTCPAVGHLSPPVMTALSCCAQSALQIVQPCPNYTGPVFALIKQKRKEHGQWDLLDHFVPLQYRVFGIESEETDDPSEYAAMEQELKQLGLQYGVSPDLLPCCHIGIKRQGRGVSAEDVRTAEYIGRHLRCPALHAASFNRLLSLLQIFSHLNYSDPSLLECMETLQLPQFARIDYARLAGMPQQFRHQFHVVAAEEFLWMYHCYYRQMINEKTRKHNSKNGTTYTLFSEENFPKFTSDFNDDIASHAVVKLVSCVTGRARSPDTITTIGKFLFILPWVLGNW